MPDFQNLWLFTLASILLIIVPGPTVTVIVANSLRQGARAGWLTILGTQIGLAMMLIALISGFSVIISTMSGLFDVIRIVGALYLAWLGVQMIRANGATLSATNDTGSQRNASSLVLQGFLVIGSNPKALLFFGAFLPQFVDPGLPPAPQLLTLGLIFMVVGAVFDGLYAIAAGSAGRWLSAGRVKWVEQLSGSCLLLGSVWLLTRRSDV